MATSAITFSASDELSGLVAASSPVSVTEEGEAHEIIGIATDLAGNSASLGVIVNIDKTMPLITGLPGEDCTLWPVNHKMAHVASVAAEDKLSGLETLLVEGESNEADNLRDSIVIENNEVSLRAERWPEGVGRTYTITATARDLAGNQREATGNCYVAHDQRKRKR